MIAADLHAGIFRNARDHPDSIALVDVDGTEVSYGELATLALGVAARLRLDGVSPGDRIGMHLPKSALSVAIIYGILAAGATCVPVDPLGPLARCVTILTDCGARAVFTAEPAAAFLRRSLGSGTQVVALSDGDATGAISGWIAGAAAPEPHWIDQESPACILYTSGSTGIPKGVVVSHRASTVFVQWGVRAFNLRPTDRLSSHAPFHFDLSILDIYGAHHAGAAACLIDEATARNPRLLADWIAERAPTIWYSTPTALIMLLDHGQLDQRDCSSLRAVLFAGEVFPVPRLRELMSRWPDARFWNLYGPTETNVCTSYEVPATLDAGVTLPIGRACEHATVVLRHRDGYGLGEGVGEILVSGPGLMTGYWNRPEETSAAFEADESGTRRYRTGDLGSLAPDGSLLFHGRVDRMIKRHGYRVELGEIEHVLTRHPSVRSAAAVADMHDVTTTVHVFLVVAAPAPSLIDLRRFCARELPGYMIPDRFHFLDDLPQTASGKTDLQALRALARG